jgi:hypothetical protein
MIWRLPHPVRGLLAAALVLLGGGLLLTPLDVGVPELVVLAALSSVTFAVVARREVPATPAPGTGSSPSGPAS